MRNEGLTALDLFSGIGGFALACERVGVRTVAFCEVDPFCRAVLAKHWPGIPVLDDVRTLDPEPFRGRVDLITGGFPCQDVSAAGKGTGIGGTRSGLWKELARIIAGVRPPWCLIENVPALRTRGADRVLADLEEIGYDAWPLVVGAWAVGAPHKRDRVWIVARLAQPDSGGSGAEARDVKREGRRPPEARASDLPERRTASVGDAWAASSDREGLDDSAEPRRAWNTGREPARTLRDAARRPEPAGSSRGGLADAGSPRLEGQRLAVRVRSEVAVLATDGPRWPARPGEPQHEWEEPRLVEFGVGCHTSRVPGRMVLLGGGLIHGTSRDSDAGQAVRAVWHPYEQTTIQRPTRGSRSLSPPPVLQPEVLGRLDGDGRADARHAPVTVAKSSAREVLRSLRRLAPPEPSSPQWGQGGQLSVECPDPLCELSHAIALGDREAKAVQAIGRRNNREALKAYGNSIVPDCAEAVLRAMLEVNP